MSDNTLNAVLRIREDTTANWSTSTFILYSGELAHDKDLNIFKMGDGVNTWSNLPISAAPYTYQPKVYSLTTGTAAATAAKVATLDGYTPAVGDLIALTLTAGNSVASPTLNINSLGAIAIRLNNSAANTTVCTLSAGAVMLLYYNGTYWYMMGSQRTSDSDNYDRTYWGNTITAGAAIYDYKLIAQGLDGKFYPLTLETGTGTTKTISTQEFEINTQILYYASTTDVAANTTAVNVYSEYPVTNLTYTSNQASWTSQQLIYLKATTNAAGNFVLDNSSPTSFMTQTIPTTEDGFVYILLGYMYSTTAMRLFQFHPVYKFRDGAFRVHMPVHSHGNITDAGKVGTTSGVPLITGTDGIVQAGSFGNSANTFCEGDDARLSDARTPTAHNHSTYDRATSVLSGANVFSDIIVAKGIVTGISTRSITATDISAAPSSHVGSTGTAHGVATTSVAGFLSSSDKTKLDGIATGANAYSHPTYTAQTSGLYKVTVDATGHVSAVTAVAKADITGLGIPGQDTVYTHPTSGVTAGTYKSVTVDVNGHITGGTNPTTLSGYGITDAAASSHVGATGSAHGVATTSVNGFMSSADKTKLDGVATGANAYTHPAYTAQSSGLYKVTVDSSGHVSAVTAVAKADITALGIPAQDTVYTHPTSGVGVGTYKSVTVDANGHVTGGTNPTTLAGYGITDAASSSHVGATGAAHGVATTSVNGFMSSDDKGKLDDIQAEANNYTHPNYTSQSLGLYKVMIDTSGHVNSVTAVAKADITALGIPAQDTVYTHPTSDGNLHVPATSTTNNGKFLMAGASAGTLSWGIPTNTTYTAGTGLSLNSTTINHSNSTTAKPSQALYPVTIDAQGHITGTGTGITIGTGTTTYLRNDGTWVTPSGGSVMVGATSGSAGTSGLVPTPAAGDQTRVLSGAGTWIEAVTTSSINTTNLTGTLTVAGWSSGVQTVTVTGMTNTLNGFLLPSSTATDAQYNAFALMMPRITAQGANSLTVTVKGTVPSIDVPFEIFAPRITTNLVETTSHAASHAYNGTDIITPLSIKAANEILTATTAPTTSTVGVLNQILINTNTSLAYVCTAVNGSVYTWQSFGGAVETLATVTARGATTGQAVSITNTTASTSLTTGALTVSGGVGVSGTLYANEVYGGVWQDYAEYRASTDVIHAGNCVIESKDGKVELCCKRLSSGTMIVSDTYGMSIGKQTGSNVAVALTGRVLAYMDKSKVKIGDPVCSGKNGTVSKMSRIECILYPDRILGTVSEIPTYEVWGPKNIVVDNRVWIKVR